MAEFDEAEAVEETSMEFFWGEELSSKCKTYEYTGEQDEEEGIESVIELRGACLGATAKSERNVVQLTTECADGNEVTRTILSMSLDKNEQVSLFLNLKPPVKLELVQGSGPVSIFGQMVSTLTDEDGDDEDLSSEEEEEKETAAALNKSQKKKRPADSPIQKPAKRKNIDQDDDTDSDDSIEEDSAMDTSYELAALKKLKTKKQNKDEEEEDEEDEEEDDLDSSSSIEDEEEEEEDEEEEEESEEEEEIKPPPKKGNKGKTAKGKPLQQQSKGTPVPKKSAKPAVKQQPSSVPVKGTKKATKNNTPSIDQIKKRLVTSPALPKKLEKFNNMLKNNFKISDDSTRKELWEYVQKNKK